MNGTARRLRETEGPELAYHRLRAALGEYDHPPVELDAGQLRRVEHHARQAYALEARVLAAPEAGDVVVPPPVVEQALDTIRARYADEDELHADLRRNGLTVDSLREALARELAVEAVLDRVKSRAADVNDLEVRLYYYLHLERFEQPETRTARHVLVTINEDFPENRRDAARARAGDIAARLQRKPKRFAEQAAKHSECPTAMQGGLLGRLPRGQLYPELDAVLFGLREGEVSGVVESPLGFHVLYCEQVHAAGPVSLAEARPRIVEKLKERQARICLREWLAGLPGVEEGA